MQKKHTFSPNHKVVDGPHNFHPAGKPGTATMGAPPSQLGGGPSAAQGGGMDASGGPSANFCNGGMKYADGGYTGPPSKLEMAGDAVKTAAKGLMGSRGGSDPVVDAQHEAQASTNKRIDDAVKEAGG
ncbi:MAG: hypothetical protein ACHRHE_23720 [Tepidisphaerales bacterium]